MHRRAQFAILAASSLALAVGAWSLTGPRGNSASLPVRERPLRERPGPVDPSKRDAPPLQSVAAARESVSAVATGPVTRVLVVDADSGQPVERVRVVRVPGAANHTRRIGEERQDYLRRVGETRWTDDHGVARFGGLLAPARFHAHSDSTNLSGATFVSSKPQQPVRIELRPACCVRVKVVDKAGQPVDRVPVLLETSAAILREWTGGDGVAVFRGVERHSVRGDERRSASVSLGVLCRVPVRAELTRWQATARDPALVTLELPPCATLVTEIDRCGNAGSVVVDVVALPAVTDTESEPVTPMQVPMTRVVPAGESSVEFAFVGLDVRLGVLARAVETGSTGRTIVPRPNGSDVTRRAEVRLSSGVHTLAGRVTLAGKPLLSAPIDLVFRHGPPIRAASGTDGSFRVKLPPMRQARPNWVLVHHRESSRSYVAEATDMTTRGSLHDLGHLRLAERPPDAAGQVVDRRGRPVPGVELTFHEGLDRVATIRSDGDGRFTLWLPRQGGTPRSMGLKVVDEAWRRTPARTIRSGESGVVVQLVGGHVLVGAAQPKHLAASRSLRWRLRPMRLDRASREWSEASADAGGGFRFEGLARGRHELLLFAGLDPRPVLRIPDLVVAPQAGADPRLRAIDLSRVLVRHRYHILGPHGSPLSGVRAHLLDQQGGATPAVDARSGRIDLVAARARRWIVFEADGFIPRRLSLRSVSGPATPKAIRLQSGIAAELTWIGDVPKAGLLLEWRPITTDPLDPFRFGHVRPHRVSRSETRTFVLPGSGRYEIRVGRRGARITIDRPNLGVLARFVGKRLDLSRR